MTALFLTGPSLLVNGDWLTGYGLLINEGRIAAVLPENERPAATRVILPPDSLLAPGLFDIQVNGGGGVLFNDTPNAETAAHIARAHRKLGTTSILPTLITDTPDKMCMAAKMQANPAKGLPGVHFEGPFLSPNRPGVHTASLIRPLLESDVALITSARGRVLVTLAPEAVPDSLIEQLTQAGIIINAGHSAASYERTCEAIAAGLRGFTHLFNATPPLSARAPGLAGAALDSATTFAGVIADGIHVHPAMLRLLIAAKGVEKTYLVSDAMAVTGTALTSFRLLGQEITRCNGHLITADGTLAGADICLADAVRFMARLGVAPAQALRMASEVPARLMRLDQDIGRIAPGLRADLVLLTPDLHVIGTWLGGEFEAAP